jgi:hypothetical protein
MNKYQQGFHEIFYWLRKKGPDPVLESFFHPRPDIFQETGFTPKVIAKILFLLPDERKQLFADFCLACLALNNEEYALKISDNLPHELLILCPQPDLKNIVHGRWIKVPILLADNRSGELRWALLSLNAPGLPAWLEKLMAPESIEAVREAASLADVEQKLYFWPILDRAGQRRLIHGRSLGLSVFLGIKSLQGNGGHSMAAATGCIDRAGRIKPVTYLNQKAEICRKNGFKALICPEQHLPDISGLEFIMVEDILQARITWKNYVPGCEFGACLALCRNQETAINMLSNMPVAVLNHLAQTSRLKQLIRDILNDQESFERFIGSIKGEISRPGWDSVKVSCLLDEIPPEYFHEVRGVDPILVHDLASLQIIKCNHLGRLKEAEQWSIISDKVNKTAVLDSLGELRNIEVFNLSLVRRHNRYMFDPYVDLSESGIAEEVKYYLYVFEKKEKQTGFALNSALGASHGTLAQNYAFCGPRYLQQTIKYAKLAMRFFAFGNIPGRARQDYLRQHAYLVYAYLDAGKDREALEYLKSYLEVSDLKEFDVNEQNPYRHACVMRFLASKSSLAPDYIAWAEKYAVYVPHQHPWQLWLKNLAMAAVDNEVKRLCLNKSISICLQGRGEQETVVPMALQSLCLLAEYSLNNKKNIIKEIRDIKSFIINSDLDRNHFQDFISLQSNAYYLQKVFRLIDTLFPFNYR